MHRFNLRVWCLAALLLTGCDIQVAVKGQQDVALPLRPKITTVKKDEYYELSAGDVKTMVAIIKPKAGRPQTVSYTYDASEDAYYATRTVHDCDEETSTIKYFAVYDKRNKLVEARDVNIDVDLDPGSIGEAELKLACQDTKDSSHV